MALPTTYNTGTATIAANDTAVTGQNTTWSTSGIQAGDMFMAAGLSVPIASVNSNTSITLADPWPGAARNAASYRISFTPDSQRVLASTRAVLDALTNGVLYAIAGLATAADKIAYFTGAGTAALATFTAFARSLVASADAATARTTLGLGSAAVVNTGTSGATVPLLSTFNTWSASQTFAASQIFSGSNAIVIDVNDATAKQVRYHSAGLVKWSVLAQGTSHNYAVQRYDASGTFTDSPIIVSWATGITTISNGLAFGTGAAATTRTNLGLGTAATQNTGTSGANVPLLSTSNVWTGTQTFGNGTGNVPVLLNSLDGASPYIQGQKGGLPQWSIFLGNATPRSGSNAGSDFQLNRHNDAGTTIDSPIIITRSTGVVSFANAPKLPSFTVATLPSAAANPQGIAYVSDGASNKRFAVSDGSNWRYPDGAIAA